MNHLHRRTRPCYSVKFATVGSVDCHKLQQYATAMIVCPMVDGHFLHAKVDMSSNHPTVDAALHILSDNQCIA